MGVEYNILMGVRGYPESRGQRGVISNLINKLYYTQRMPIPKIRAEVQSLIDGWAKAEKESLARHNIA